MITGTSSAVPFDAGDQPDEDIVRQVLDGNTGMFELLMRRYNERVYRVARAIVRNEQEAEDVMQQAYVNAYTHLGQFNGSARFSTWLTRIAVNEALGRLRRVRPAGRDISFDDPERKENVELMANLTTPGPDPEQSAARDELRRLMEQAIDALPETYRTVFVLRGMEEMSVAETAGCLELEPATVKTRYHRARRILQQHLAGLLQAASAEAFPFAGERCDRIVAGVFRRLGVDRS